MRFAAFVLTTTMTLAVAGPALATADVEKTRLAGEDRYATAAAIAMDTFPDRRIITAAIARGDAFPDALSAVNVLAKDEPGRTNGGPILLTAFDRLPRVTAHALRQIGVQRVQILGDEGVVSPAVERQLRDMGIFVTRYAGRDRYETNAESFRAGKYGPEAGSPASIDGKFTALLTSGTEFADAMIAAPLSHAAFLPLLLTDPRQLPASTRNTLTAFPGQALEQVLIVGGTSAVSQAVENEVRALGLTVQRISGTSRQGTALALAEFATAKLGWSGEHVNLARGDAYPDAIAGAPHAGEENAPTLLTVSVDELGEVTRRALQDRSDTVASIHVYGDQSAVSDGVVAQARDAATP